MIGLPTMTASSTSSRRCPDIGDKLGNQRVDGGAHGGDQVRRRAGFICT
jgi:hypothetical protein